MIAFQTITLRTGAFRSYMPLADTGRSVPVVMQHLRHEFYILRDSCRLLFIDVIAETFLITGGQNAGARCAAYIGGCVGIGKACSAVA